MTCPRTTTGAAPARKFPKRIRDGGQGHRLPLAIRSGTRVLGTFEANGTTGHPPVAGYGNGESGNGRRGNRDGDGDRAGEIPGSISCDRGEGIRTGRHPRCIPRDGIWIGGIFCAEVGAIETELDARDSHVIRRGGRNGDEA